MKIMILHLSDIHLKGSEHAILKRVEKLKNSIQYLESELECCFIVVSGDTVFSGCREEYEIAANFFSELKGTLSASSISPEVKHIFIPGNHDCNLKERNTQLRSSIINQIAFKQAELADGTIIDCCTSVQQDFFEFISSFEATRF